MAVPLLSARNTRAQSTGRAPLRFLTVMDSYGIAPDNRTDTWIDSTVGDYALGAGNLGTILAPLAAYRDNLIVASNISSDSSAETRDAVTHDKITSQSLTGSQLVDKVVGAAGTQHHESIDVRIGKYLSNEYGLDFPRVYPHLYLSDYAEGTKTSFCFDEGGNQIRSIAGSQNIVASLFGSATGNQESLALDAASQNIALGLVRERLDVLRPDLINANASQVMDAYESSVQDLATELELRAGRSCIASQAEATARLSGDSPPLVFDAIFQAFACDLASCITYSIGGEQINQIRHDFLYDAALHNDAEVQAALSTNYHAVSHQETAAAGKAHEVVRTWQSGMIADLLDRLSTTPDIDGSMLLDNTVVFISSAMSHNTHQRSDYCWAMVAGSNTNLKGGVHYDCSGHTNNEFLATLAQGVTAPVTEVGGFDGAGNRIDSLNGGPIAKMLKEVHS